MDRHLFYINYVQQLMKWNSIGSNTSWCNIYCFLFWINNKCWWCKGMCGMVIALFHTNENDSIRANNFIVCAQLTHTPTSKQLSPSFRIVFSILVISEHYALCHTGDYITLLFIAEFFIQYCVGYFIFPDLWYW